MAINDDLLSFREHLTAPAGLFVCMGDTLTHLPNRRSVEQLFSDVANMLVRGGTFIMTFRDYSAPLIGAKGAEWRTRVSAYRKLRLSPEWVVRALESQGLQVKREQGFAGMIRLIATRPR